MRMCKYPKDVNTLGGRIRIRRLLTKGLSLRLLGEKIRPSSPVSQSYLWQIEENNKTPSLLLLKKIEFVLGFQKGELLNKRTCPACGCKYKDKI